MLVLKLSVELNIYVSLCIYETNDRWTTNDKNIVANTFVGNLNGNADSVTNGIYNTSSVTT